MLCSRHPLNVSPSPLHALFGNPAETRQILDQFLVASEFKMKYAWLALYFFVVYLFFNLAYYYEAAEVDRVTFEVFDWEEDPDRACLWLFLILAFLIPLFSGAHYFVYRYGRPKIGDFHTFIAPHVHARTCIENRSCPVVLDFSRSCKMEGISLG